MRDGPKVAGSEPVEITAEMLRRDMPLPMPDGDGDKTVRGTVLVVGGSPEVPGAALLAGVGALRAGAGRLQMAVPRSVAIPLALAVPEALVAGLDETPGGGVDCSAADDLLRRIGRCEALLLGPGMTDRDACGTLTADLLARLEPGATGIVLDAEALVGLGRCADAVRRHAGRVAITPHGGEMAKLLGVTREAVMADPLGAACRARDLLGAAVAMKGGTTYIAGPEGESFVLHHGHVGLATSGSGDTLAGIVAGLVARGAGAAQALAWGTWLHAEAGHRVARARGPLGFLARELLAEVPGILADLGGRTGAGEGEE